MNVCTDYVIYSTNIKFSQLFMCSEILRCALGLLLDVACFDALVFNGLGHLLRRVDQFGLKLGHCLAFLLVCACWIIWRIAGLAARLVRELTVLVHASFLGELGRLQILDQAILNASWICSCVDVHVVRSLSVWSKVEDSVLANRILGSLILAVSLLTR